MKLKITVNGKYAAIVESTDGVVGDKKVAEIYGNTPEDVKHFALLVCNAQAMYDALMYTSMALVDHTDEDASKALKICMSALKPIILKQ